MFCLHHSWLVGELQMPSDNNVTALVEPETLLTYWERLLEVCRAPPARRIAVTPQTAVENCAADVRINASELWSCLRRMRASMGAPLGPHMSSVLTEHVASSRERIRGSGTVELLCVALDCDSGAWTRNTSNMMQKFNLPKTRGTMTDRTQLAEFVNSMPTRYAQAFDSPAIEQHAKICLGRRERPVNVGTFGSRARAGTALCVVAVDRPGLLATLSRGFVACDLDIVGAEVFTRQVIGQPDEALDLFWVRRQARHRTDPLEPAEVHHLRRTLANLLVHPAQDELPYGNASQYPAPTGTVVQFFDNGEGDLITLQVETDDRNGLLLGLCQALFSERVEIVGSRIRVREGRTSGQFEIVGSAGEVISHRRRDVIKAAVLAAIDRLSGNSRPLMVG
ncbi:MAG TPA: hypothetical protein VKP30_13230 [Polyangiaceae bacterium]|nr:hypothetical protein [Polyangiaceae bacterium]